VQPSEELVDLTVLNALLLKAWVPSLRCAAGRLPTFAWERLLSRRQVRCVEQPFGSRNELTRSLPFTEIESFQLFNHGYQFSRGLVTKGLDVGLFRLRARLNQQPRVSHSKGLSLSNPLLLLGPSLSLLSES
jgi:hypothetical protein